MGLGFRQLARPKGNAAHRSSGRRFAYATFVVVASAIVGLAVFQFRPLFAVLSLLVLYQTISGWRAVQRRELGPGLFDAVWTLSALATLAWLIPRLVSGQQGSSTVVYASLGGIVFILAYDAIRWVFPRRWFAELWRYEHSYKLVSSLFAMLSAFVGNVVRVGQPWSQLLPSAIGTAVIVYFFVQFARERANATRIRSLSPT